MYRVILLFICTYVTVRSGYELSKTEGKTGSCTREALVRLGAALLQKLLGTDHFGDSAGPEGTG